MIPKKTCILIQQEISNNGNKFIQNSYYTRDYVVAIGIGKTVIYLHKENAQFHIDLENKKMTQILLSQKQQFNDFKQMIGKIEYNENIFDDRRVFLINNDTTSSLQMKTKIIIKKSTLLKETCNFDYYLFSKKFLLFDIDLKEDEYIYQSKGIFITNNKEQVTETKVLKIEEANDKISEFDAYLKYNKL